MRHAKEEQTCNSEQAIDLNSAVEELNGLSSQELSKLLRDSENFTLHRHTEKGLLVQIDMEKLASSLPMHLLAVLLSRDRGDIYLRYMLQGLRLLHSLCDLARQTRLEQILLDDVKIMEQILDLVFYMLIVLGSYGKEHATSFVSLLHSALVACSLHLLTGSISSQWQDVVHVLLAHPKELCKNGGILSLAQAVLKLDIPPHLQESSMVVAAVSRMKSKVLSILVQLCETESISYLDEVASSPRSMQLAKSVALEVLELLKTVFGREPKQLGDCLDNSYPRGLVLLNSMRLTDIFSDDSNFRSFITLNITQVLVEIFSLPPEEFCSSWCSTDLPLTEEDAVLEYDPFVAAGAILALPSTTFGTSLLASDPSNETIKECPFILNNIPQASYAQQRTSFLVKIIANLHCFVPNICEEQERNLFFNKFLECLQTELPKTLPGFLLTHDTQKAATVCENLCSLLAHAKSLIPNLLNEEDVQLLSFFYKQLQSLITSAQVEAKPVQGQVQENKFGDLLHKFSNYRLNEHHQEVQGIGAARKLDPKIREVAPDLNDKSGRHKDDISDNSTFEDLYKFGMTGKGTDPPDDVMDPDGRRKDKNGIGKSASESFRETDKDLRTVEPSSSDGKNSFDQMMDNDDFPKLAEHAKESAFMGSQDNEKTETMQFEEKQRRKRKRNIMNDTQITLIERALLDEPEMQRNATLLQSWADKLSVHGSELTSSQLKNWLNNRKARLARAAREARAPSEGDNTFPDKQGGSGQAQFYDSPESPSEDFYVPPSTARAGSNQSTPKFGGVTLRTGSGEASEMTPTDFVDFAAKQSMQMDCSSLGYAQYEPGQYVSLIDGEGKEVGRGNVYQVEGRWHGKSLAEAGTCIVDVHELKVERGTRLQHPVEAAGTTFDEAESKNGVMRVAWDVNKILPLRK